MFEVVLLEPEIPPNAGNVIRLCANAGARLHLIGPLGFRLSDRALRRAGLDYHVLADIRLHASYTAFFANIAPPRVLGFTAGARRCYADVAYRPGDALLFGPETRGLPADVLATLPPGQRLRLPMRAGNRSLNLANAVAVALYEAWRQLGFDGADPPTGG